jgi:hypothetical protein
MAESTPPAVSRRQSALHRRAPPPALRLARELIAERAADAALAISGARYGRTAALAAPAWSSAAAEIGGACRVLPTVVLIIADTSRLELRAGSTGSTSPASPVGTGVGEAWPTATSSRPRQPRGRRLSTRQRLGVHRLASTRVLEVDEPPSIERRYCR